MFSFNDDFAFWLSNNLEHLNRGSIFLLENLSSNSFEGVRYSTVVSLSKISEHKTFQKSLKFITSILLRKKRSCLERGVIASLKDGTKLSLEQFRKVVSISNKTEIMDELHKHKYDMVPLHEWIEKSQQQQLDVQFGDSPEFLNALHEITELNNLSRHREADVIKNRNDTVHDFQAIDFPINNDQVAIASVLTD